MTLKTVTQKSQNETSRKPAFEKVVKQVKDYAGLILRGEEAKKLAVEVVNDFIATVPRAERESVRDKLYKATNVPRSTFFRWQKEVEEDAEIGDEVRRLADKGGRTLTSKFRVACLEAKRENPEARASEVFQKACGTVDRPKERVETDPRSALMEAINRYLRDSNDNVEGLIESLKNAPIPREKFCKEFCK